MVKPQLRPLRNSFSSGPCVKHPGWSWQDLEKTPLSRSHRGREGEALLQSVIDKTRAVLAIPSSHRIAIVPGSTTGAMEMALWSLLGSRGVDVFSWDVFGDLWAYDVQHQLCLPEARCFTAPFGILPDVSVADPKRDCVFTWCGTTAGVWLPNGDWIADDREGLAICDATSAVFAVDLPWPKLDAVAFSWQKGLGGEAAHGMLVLSPRAIQRLQDEVPAWPMPRLFRMVREGKLLEGLFKGETLNTPSLLCAQDTLNALHWVEKQGGMPEMVQRVTRNFQEMQRWVDQTPWVTYMAERAETIAQTAVCLKVTDLVVSSLSVAEQRDMLNKMGQLLAQEQVAFDVVNHALAPPSLRIWCGPMVDSGDLARLFPWLDWAFQEILISA